MSVRIEFLRKVPLFQDLSEEDLTPVAELFQERSYAKNNIIFFENQTGDYMYVVKEGQVKVVRQLPNGKEMILAFHEVGEYFGEMSLLDGGTTPATVVAVAPTTILSMNRRDFQALLEHPQINRALLTVLCNRCRDAWAQVEMLTFHQSGARMRAALYHLCRQKGAEVAEGGIRIGIRLTHRELADIAGISRETATRALSHLQSEGLIRVESGHVIVGDPDELLDSLFQE